METLVLGAAAIAAGGVLNGTFAYPMKLVKGWNWENIWFLFGAFGLLLFPAAVAFGSIEGLWDVYATIPASRIALVLVLGLAWGSGSLLFGLGISALGFSLGYAMVMGTTAIFGTVVPALALSTSVLASRQGAMLVASLALIVVGLAFCTIAGRKRERMGDGAHAPDYRILSRTQFRKGLALCVVSGLLSACFNIGFSQAAHIVDAAVRAGAGKAAAGFAAWAPIMSAGFLPSLIYCTYLFFRNGSFGKLRGGSSNWVYALAMGVLWILTLRLYGTGAQYIGERGAALGWPIMTSSAIIGANLLGLTTAEWRGVPAHVRAYLYWGIAGLLGAVVLAGMSLGGPSA